MNKSTLMKMSKKELINIASESGIKKSMGMIKSDLIKEILSARNIDSGVGLMPPRAVDQGGEKVEIRGESKKFETQNLTRFIEPEYPIDEAREIPPGYGDTKIVAMIRDPYWAFTYWEINHEKRKELSILGQHSRKLFLRVYDVTDVRFNGFNAHSSFDVEINNMSKSWYIQLPVPNRSYCIDIAFLDNDGNYILIARSNTIAAPRDAISDNIDQDWMSANDDEMYRLSGGYKVSEWIGSEMISKMLSNNLSSGAVASSSNRPVKSENKDFRLVVNTELIVYGATEPDAKVTIQGHDLKLRPDGTFTVRFALPDGRQEIPVNAVKSDGSIERKITPVVEKSTKMDIE